MDENLKNKPMSLEGVDTFKNCMMESMLGEAQNIQTAVDEAKNKAEIAIAAAQAAGANVVEFTLPSNEWYKTDETYSDYTYAADIYAKGITAQDSADVIFDIGSIDLCMRGEVAPAVKITKNTITVYSKKALSLSVSGVYVYANGNGAAGVGRTNISFKRAYYPNGGAWDNKSIKDSAGKSSAMVRIPKMTWKELGINNSDEIFPAFIVMGQEVDNIWVGKYEANVNACSVKNGAPETNIKYNDAAKACSNKGEGWHMMTRLEWMAIAYWSAKHRCLPMGIDSGNNILTGDRDTTYAHNGSESGIWDLSGLNDEWLMGVRILKNELQVVSADGVTFGNDAVSVDSSEESLNWYAVNALTGALITPNGKGTTTNSLKIRSPGIWGTTSGTKASPSLSSITCDSNVCQKARNILMALGFYKPASVDSTYCYGTEDSSDVIGFNIGSYPYVCQAGFGGGNTVSIGIFGASFYYESTDKTSTVGYRPAYCEM